MEITSKKIGIEPTRMEEVETNEWGYSPAEKGPYQTLSLKIWLEATNTQSPLDWMSCTFPRLALRQSCNEIQLQSVPWTNWKQKHIVFKMPEPSWTNVKQTRVPFITDFSRHLLLPWQDTAHQAKANPWRLQRWGHVINATCSKQLAHQENVLMLNDLNKACNE